MNPVRTAILMLTLVVSTASSAPASIELTGERAFPESISSATDGTLYVGSVGVGGVVRIRPGNSSEQWIKPGDFGSASIFGVMIDESSHTLWVCSNNMLSLGVKISGALPGSALIGYDLHTGLGRIRAVLPGPHVFCNDIAVSPDGNVYVTNTEAPEILRLAPRTSQLQVRFTDPALVPPPGEPGLDGIAFDGDGNLYVNRIGPGDVFRIDVENGTPQKLSKIQLSRNLQFPDALRPLGHHAFLVIEGVGRLALLTVTNHNATVDTLAEGFQGPTGVTRSHGYAWVTEGQLSYLFDKAKSGLRPNLPFRIYKVPLTPRVAP